MINKVEINNSKLQSFNFILLVFTYLEIIKNGTRKAKSSWVRIVADAINGEKKMKNFFSLYKKYKQKNRKNKNSFLPAANGS